MDYALVPRSRATASDPHDGALWGPEHEVQRSSADTLTDFCLPSSRNPPPPLSRAGSIICSQNTVPKLCTAAMKLWRRAQAAVQDAHDDLAVILGPEGSNKVRMQRHCVDVDSVRESFFSTTALLKLRHAPYLRHACSDFT